MDPHWTPRHLGSARRGFLCQRSWQHLRGKGNQAVADEREALLVLTALDVVGHALDVVEAVVGEPRAPHANQVTGLERPAVPEHVELALPADRVGGPAGLAQ